MRAEEHITAAREFLAAERLLTDRWLGMIAAESMWGAAVQAIDALMHLDGQGHADRNRARERIIQNLIGAGVLDKERLDDFQYVLISLHNHFYTVRLSPGALAMNLRIGRGFVNSLLAAAERQAV